MAYIFLDESGDLGFDCEKKGTSRYFLITFLFCENKRALEMSVRKIFRSFTAKEIARHAGSLHAHSESPKIRRKLLERLIGKDISILAMYVDKKRLQGNKAMKKHAIYNEAAASLLRTMLRKKAVYGNGPIRLVASRRETNRFLNENFSKHLTKRALADHAIDLQVEIKPPQEEKGLQVVDLISWSIFRKYEYGDDTYYDIVKQKIAEEDQLLL